jgi:hypothetical protein
MGGKDKLRALSSRELFKVVAQVPCLLAWARDHAGALGWRPAEVFLAEDASPTQTQAVLSDVLDAVDSEGGDPSLGMLRSVAGKYPVASVVQAVKVALLSCEPRLVSDAAGDALLDCMEELGACHTAREVAQVVGPRLDDLPLSHYVALAELCAFWRDGCEEHEAAEIATIYGPALLIGPRSQGARDAAAEEKAGMLMDLLVLHCDLAFGQMLCGARDGAPQLGGRAKGYLLALYGESAWVGNEEGEEEATALGARNNSSGSSSSTSSGGGGGRRVSSSRSSSKPPAPTMDEDRLKELERFYKPAPLKARRAHLLLENYDFLAVARAIHARAPGQMPATWERELAAMKKRGQPDVAWYDAGAAEQATLLRKRQNDGATESPRKARGGSVAGLVLVPSPPQPPSLLQRQGSGEGERPPWDRVIDELLDTEMHYYGCLKEALAFGRRVGQVQKEGRPEARAKLGLSADEIETCFGSRLEALVHLCEELLAQVEVINLVREPPRNAFGRAGLLCDALLAIHGNLHYYAPYVSAHKKTHRIISEASEAVRLRASGGNSRLRKASLSAASVAQRYQGTFEEIWTDISQRSRRLQGLSLQSVLIMPVQRLPRYELLLADLLKKLPQEHPARHKVENALEVVTESAQQVNAALRSHEKVAAMLGDDELLPTGSRRLDETDGTGAEERPALTSPSTLRRKNSVKNLYSHGPGPGPGAGK